jgi:hypothetical protein
MKRRGKIVLVWVVTEWLLKFQTFATLNEIGISEEVGRR